ncbi:MAG: response regulator [Magnetococcales bacterium]|nr:response regulator [Magnetococcales bacterium]MBF0115277.1 response regulator [Magnetococcales bacterium]
MDKPLHILVVDDNREIRELLARYLREQGMTVTTLGDGRQLFVALAEKGIDLLVLDLMLPGEGGIALCRRLRQTSSLPVIMLTALGEHGDRITGLDAGADDYLTKPFDPGELLARIRAVLRRTQGKVTVGETVFSFAGWQLYVDRRELVDARGIIEPLSAGEFDLLMAFVLNPQRILDRERLLDLAWGGTTQLYDRSIDTQVMRLRRKIEIDSRAPELIKTVWGSGYLFTPNVTRI